MPARRVERIVGIIEGLTGGEVARPGKLPHHSLVGSDLDDPVVSRVRDEDVAGEDRGGAGLNGRQSSEADEKRTGKGDAKNYGPDSHPPPEQAHGPTPNQKPAYIPNHSNILGMSTRSLTQVHAEGKIRTDWFYLLSRSMDQERTAWP